MTYWLLIFAGGLLGTAHCVGMCGGFVLTLGHAQPRPGANLRRQLVYALGRICTYTFCGTVAGYGGLRLVHSLRSLVNVQAWLLVAAGLLVLIQGLLAAGILPQPRLVAGKPACAGAGLLAALLRGPALATVFVAGMLNGLIPCGLVYAYLALACSSGDVWNGGLTMLAFGLGTVPVLVLVGCGSGWLAAGGRRRLFTVAAWCMVLTGILTLYRGAEVLASPELSNEEAGCPLCR